jgi:hypothetical protein
MLSNSSWRPIFKFVTNPTYEFVIRNADDAQSKKLRNAAVVHALGRQRNLINHGICTGLSMDGKVLEPRTVKGARWR